METCYYVIAIAVYVASTMKMRIGSENIALGKNTKQSSVYGSWDSSKAVDGCVLTGIDSNCCTHTAGSQNEAWWQVDLQTQFNIESMKIIYREDDGYLHRLAGYQIYLSNTTIWRTEDACYQDTTPDLASMSSVQTVACPGVARYLTIYNDRRVKSFTWYSDDAFLELCEVEVYGCPLRQYGAGNCASRCSTTCVDDLCHPTTGKCTEDCDDGFFGPFCDPCSTGCTDPVCNRTSGYCGCKEGYHGNDCSQLCSTKCKGNACVKETGFCAGCDQGFRGDACRDRCPVNCKANTCFQYSGSCTECEPGFYGTMCDKTCVSISCKDNICNQTDGQCTECAPGLYGAACDQNCPDNCNEECDRVTGICNGCDQGVRGLYCSEICPKNCQSNTCIQDNGHCTECKTGYYAEHCDKGCPYNCKENICNHTYGHCLECQSGYYGEHCDKICPQNCKDMCDKTNGDCTDLTATDSINTAAIGIGAGFGVVILVLVILVIVQNRRLSMKNKDTTGPIHMSDILQRAKTNDIDGPYQEIDTQNGKQLAKNATAENDYDRLDPKDKVVPNLYETV
ncbi:scavenger receptor class F member 1-like [Mizuhopecten yessoensis]|uniref:scavenger receptor class F member 1-like n=1 Tax=Mizuhopecten yessoensis TaxID=6573 RepID=UPI000B45AB42|nr:scavenger receptor class F member 1-like [Mizuhopecten yessoensis]